MPGETGFGYGSFVGYRSNASLNSSNPQVQANESDSSILNTGHFLMQEDLLTLRDESKKDFKNDMNTDQINERMQKMID